MGLGEVLSEVLVEVLMVAGLLWLLYDNYRLEVQAERLKQDCADAYMAFGAVADDLAGKVSDEDIERFLDNMSAAVHGESRPHELLPFPREATACAKIRETERRTRS